MNTPPVRIGLIGAGRIGASHAEIIAHRVHTADLVAVADPRPGVAAELAESLGARGETTPEAIFAADDIDAVVISASSTVHAELIFAAAEAGKHVFSEKPAGMNLKEIDQACAATASADVAFQVGFYDVRGEVFGSEGMVTAGDGSQSSMRLFDASGRSAATSRGDVELLLDAYTAEFIEFAEAIRGNRTPSVTGDDARAAFAIAAACIESYATGVRAAVDQGA